jgi:putative hemolysin
MGDGSPFCLCTASSPRWYERLLAGSLERLLGLQQLDDWYRELDAGADLDAFLTGALARLEIDVSLAPGELDRIPDRGPVVVVANHPYGGVEGLLAAKLLRQVRADTRILANHLLGRIPELREILILVDPFAGAGAVRRNVRPLCEAVRWLEDGGLLLIFPAGAVAHRTWQSRVVRDPPWQPSLARVVRRTGATVVPLHFGGHNGRAFQLAGLLHPALRTALLPRALVACRGATIPVRVGNAIAPDRLAPFTGDEELMRYLRLRTEILGRPATRPRPVWRPAAPGESGVPLVPPVPPGELAREVAALPPDRLLSSSRGLATYLARGEEIPALLVEIGRLRELTFRAVGEGTGRACDLDAFDQDYLHLFVWDDEACRVIGGYRLGPTDRLIESGGLGKLYSSTLFRLHPEFVRHVTPGLELGRSFVRPDCQKGYLPLLLLWRGIGTHVARHPQYHRLFGPVSISPAYQHTSLHLMLDHLRTHELHPELASRIRPRRPVRGGRRVRRVLHWTPETLRSLEDVSAMVAELEDDGRGVPVLIREYLKLGGKLLGFNVDPDFGHTVDGLVLVDLRDTPRRLLERYMGPAAAAAFLQYHRAPLVQVG